MTLTSKAIVARQHRVAGREQCVLRQQRRPQPCPRPSERGVRLARNMQVGPCIPVGNWEYSYKGLKLAQLLGQLGVFLTEVIFSIPCPLFVLYEESAMKYTGGHGR